MPPTLSLLCLAPQPPRLEGSRWGDFRLTVCDSLDALAERLREQSSAAALLVLDDARPLRAWPALSHAVLDAALVVLLPAVDAETATALLQAGVQDVLTQPAADEDIARALRLAIERKAIEQAARRAYATDLATGLPNHAQLKEHLTHLLALREREPAPMAAIALRIEGLSRVASALGVESANVLRRKAAVRLRAGLRASDVVASIGPDAFAVLLAWIDSPADGERVAAKLAAALAQPFSVAGRQQTLAVSAGLASYPEHGREADTLLRRAIGQATQAATVGAAGLAQAADRGPDAAANDEP